MPCNLPDLPLGNYKNVFFCKHNGSHLYFDVFLRSTSQPHPNDWCGFLRHLWQIHAIAVIKIVLLFHIARLHHEHLYIHSPMPYHATSPCTQSVGHVLFRHAWYASWRGCAGLACLLRWHPLLLIGSSPKVPDLQDLILYHFHRWGCWGFLQRCVPQETQPK